MSYVLTWQQSLNCSGFILFPWCSFRFARLKNLIVVQVARSLYVRFTAHTGDAMGMNMLSKVSHFSIMHACRVSKWFLDAFFHYPACIIAPVFLPSSLTESEDLVAILFLYLHFNLMLMGSGEWRCMWHAKVVFFMCCEVIWLMQMFLFVEQSDGN